MINDEEVGILLDKQAIHEIVLRCARGSDRLDLELFESAFHPDAELTYDGLFSGGVKEVVQRVGSFLQTLDGTMHIIANHLVDVDGDDAYGETYVNAYHWATPRDDPARNFMSVTRYIDRFERRDRRWRIRKRTSLRSLMEPRATFVVPSAQAQEGLRSTGDRNDLSYVRESQN